MPFRVTVLKRATFIVGSHFQVANVGRLGETHEAGQYQWTTHTP